MSEMTEQEAVLRRFTRQTETKSLLGGFWVTDIDAMANHIVRLERILAALREPSEGMMAAVLNPNATAGRRLAVRFILDAAVAAAEQEVGRE